MGHKRAVENQKTEQAKARSQRVLEDAQARADAFVDAVYTLTLYMMPQGRHGMKVKEIRVRYREDHPQKYLGIIKATESGRPIVAFAGGDDPVAVLTHVGRAIEIDALRWREDVPYGENDTIPQVRRQGALEGVLEEGEGTG